MFLSNAFTLLPSSQPASPTYALTEGEPGLTLSDTTEQIWGSVRTIALCSAECEALVNTRVNKLGNPLTAMLMLTSTLTSQTAHTLNHTRNTVHQGNTKLPMI